MSYKSAIQSLYFSMLWFEHGKYTWKINTKSPGEICNCMPTILSLSMFNGTT